KVENSDDFSLVDQWQTEDGSGAAPSDIRIGGKRALRRCIIDNHGLSRPYCIANDRLRQRDWTACTALLQVHGYIFSARCCLCVYPQFLTLCGNQEASLGAGVLEGRAHEPVDELFQNDLARKYLRDFDHGCEVELLDRGFDRASRS